MRKGQSATEYLMIYGWAILAIAIVAALLYTQVFSTSRNAYNTTTEGMGIDAVNLCMAGCRYDLGVSNNHYISHSEKCNLYVDIMTDAGVSQNIINEYEQICLFPGS